MTGRVAKVMLLVTVLLVACSRNAPTASSSPSPSFSAGKIAWTDCGSGFQCGKLQVPLDYMHPNGRTISIALTRKPATDTAKRIGSLLLNPGGPGASGIDYVKADVKSLSHLNTRFDLVAWDPRGVGASTPVTCVDGPTLDHYLSIDSVLDDPQEKTEAIQADQDFAAGCAAHSGYLLPFLDSASSARDIDQIRAAVGDSKLTYLGFSYGTNYGEWYAHLFPTRVRALALDGVVDPTVTANESNYGQVLGFEQNLQAFLSDCRGRSTCTFGRPGDPGQKLTAFIARLDTTPLPVGTRTLTRTLALTGVLQLLYDQRLWSTLDSSLTAATGGDGRLLLAVADFYDKRNANGTYGNLWNGAYYSQWCMDHSVPTEIAAYDQLVPKFTAASALFGPYSVYGNLQCAYWPAKPTYDQSPLTAPGAPPILLIGGTNDPATPYAEAQSVNRVIAGSVLLTRSGEGHTSYDSSVCSHDAEDAYLLDLTLPAPGTVCSS